MAKSSISQELAVMWRHSFDMLIFFVTGQCNSKCRHCFYWRNIDPVHRGLTIEDVSKLARSMPPFRTLLLSGGEPTLRSDLVQLVEAFRVHNGVQTVSVPTNGLMPERIVQIAQDIAQLDSHLYVTFNVSLDGFAEVHDAIRGVPGSFERAVQTLQGLGQIGERHPNFQALVNTVICADNYEQIVPFADYIQSQGLADGHFFELVRGEPPEAGMSSVPPEELRRIYRALVPIQEQYLVRTAWRKRRGLFGLWRQMTDVGNLINRYRHQWHVYSLGEKWKFPCMAGEGIGVIDYDGQLRVCELREQRLDLSECDYDFGEAWYSPVIRKEAAIAKTHVCDCTHTCFLGISIRQDWAARFLVAPWLYLLYKLGRLW